mgnify:CR=1 FL=1
MDVVEALPSDWTTDPFTLVEKDGYFYGRGTQDMKDGVAIIINLLGLGLIVYVCIKTRFELRLLLVFAIMIAAGAFISPAISNGRSERSGATIDWAGAGLLGAVCAWMLSPAGPRQARVRIWAVVWPLVGLALTVAGDMHGPPLLLGFALIFIGIVLGRKRR